METSAPLINSIIVSK